MKGHWPHLKNTTLLTKQHLWSQTHLASLSPRSLGLQNEQGVTRCDKALLDIQLYGELIQGQLPNREGFRKAYRAHSFHLI